MREVYRILDANFNRAREALRVIEDFARFALDDAAISSQAKDLRSRLQEACQRFPPEALLAARDTPGDVGTVLTSPTEARRADAPAVVSAACKRLTEALRTLEEYAKVAAATEAGRFQALRYEAYSLEQRVGFRLSASRFEKVRLYVLLTKALCRGDALEVARAAVAGGAECIQVREKTAPARALLEHARSVRQLTADAGALMIVNDRPDITAAAGGDGVHLGQDDLPVAAARRILPPGALIGVSTHNLAQARAAAAAGADYISVGPMFPTQTKDAGPLAGPAVLKQVLAEIATPHVAVGGITAENVGELVAAGCRRVAVCSAVISAPDPRAAAQAIRKRLPATG